MNEHKYIVVSVDKTLKRKKIPGQQRHGTHPLTASQETFGTLLVAKATEITLCVTYEDVAKAILECQRNGLNWAVFKPLPTGPAGQVLYPCKVVFHQNQITMIDQKLEVERPAKPNDGVHTSHCCAAHGCKYGDKDCPVEMRLLVQEYACEDCGSW